MKNQGYVIYGGELSYFTRKLEAAMTFYGADFELRQKGGDFAKEVEARSGTHQVPVLHTPENWMIADTTPLLGLLDSRFPFRRLFPQGPLGVLVHVVEEYFDEWLPRTMVHYRWHYPESARFASERMEQASPGLGARVLEWGPKACRATGTESDIQQRAAEAEYVRVLEAAERQLAESPYLLGDRPTAVDCIVLGGLRAHTNLDPDPKKIVSGYPRVVAWSEGGADAWTGDGELAPFPDSTPFARFVLAEMASTFRPYLLACREACAQGDKAFHVEIYGEEVSYLTRPYVERSSRMVTDRIRHRLSAEERTSVAAWLAEVSLADCFLD